ncbi:hypothetical protein ABT263_20760 [Kitasatospora sp. NPDC001603]|uniref:hypothetical protein n=1 Tax=Kitasatospora sp. NPDC001603 TaxID=3154388 RepID=UPI003321BFB5
MVDHRELYEDVTAALARAGFDTERGPSGPSGLRIAELPQGVLVGWSPGADQDAGQGAEPGGDGAGGPGDAAPPPVEGIRTAMTGAIAAVLRESGYRVAEAGPGELLVTAGPRAREEAVRSGGAPEAVAVPEQWWG